jgi:dTDP-4-amino-4,6-dideoxygalactose transaminase
VAERLAELTGSRHVLLTPNATQAMEVALMAIGIGPGDEVLMPSFGFVGQANAVLARGATPVFCDVDPATLNMDPADTAARITRRTRVLFPVHYAGVAADTTAFRRLAKQHGLFFFEDAAHCLGAKRGASHLGTIGDAGFISFHVTKNLSCGEGGALLLRDPELARAAEVILEKGTDRSAFLRGQVDKYTWVGPGGSYVLSDLLAALLEAQLKRTAAITRRRVQLWEAYHAGFEELENLGLVRRPRLPRGTTHNGHTYFLLARTPEDQQRILAALHRQKISACFHFQPLHDSPYALANLGEQPELPVTSRVADTIIRLPLYHDLTKRELDRVIAETYRAAIAD